MQLTVREVAEVLNVSEKTIYRWIKQGSLPAYRVNEQYRFNRAEILEWATSRRINVSPAFLAEPESSATPLPGLAEALREGGIYFRLSGTDRDSVLRAVVDVMRLPPEVDRTFLLQVLIAREALGSTGIGDGIAIPHARNPIVLHVERPMVSLCFLERPIDFGALDGKPVHVLFSVVSPTVRAHLHILSRIAFALRDDGFKEGVMRVAGRDEILAAAAGAEAALPAARRVFAKKEE
ncbi:MAG: PTS sugar transporter subunit IIA [Planctomycetes bacterium]|nr:PTS sugar transporter subunit IIA [Planctomycetota bacterium]